MELREPIEEINKNLIREFGLHSDGRPNFRVVFSEDQIEKRWVTHTKDGFELINPEVKEVPKYRQWIHPPRYVLERLVPTGQGSDLLEQTSYEPSWVFQTSKGEYLPPIFEACKFIVDAIMTAAGRSDTHAKYKAPDESDDAKAERLKTMEDYLFGEETSVTDALHYGFGVTVPENTLLKEAEKKMVN